MNSKNSWSVRRSVSELPVLVIGGGATLLHHVPKSGPSVLSPSNTWRENQEQEDSNRLKILPGSISICVKVIVIWSAAIKNRIWKVKRLLKISKTNVNICKQTCEMRSLENLYYLDFQLSMSTYNYCCHIYRYCQLRVWGNRDPSQLYEHRRLYCIEL